jgi:predicted alpha/beta hydrolase family esterase
MARTAIIFHGTGANPNVAWLPWLRDRLLDRGYAVEVPHYEDLNVEPIATFLPKVLANHTLDETTVLVGHSGGAALLLAVLQHTPTPVAQAILVAGYSTRPNDSDEPVLQDAYGWAAIKAHVKDIYFINSRTDPYGCDEGQAGRCSNGSAAPSSSVTMVTSATTTSPSRLSTSWTSSSAEVASTVRSIRFRA